MPDDENKIYALYFDKDGCGPTALELVPFDFAEMKPPKFGLNFKMGGGFNLNDAPIGAGLFFSQTSQVVELHKALGEWIARNLPT